ncbi:9407_t:CDS:2 [Acaulospora morrowiae]|uniref:9407_t:CDS:1 n=1 Tax=Acaulospora morrowiae TaxID=94023 RepID=A0A9N9FTF0_9GLOM|nr:9407_t:CDS:2 [Acaulospora morrowiae]
MSNSMASIIASSNKQSSVHLTHQIDENTLHLDSIVTFDKRVKNRKPRSRGIAPLQSNKSVRISDSSNSGASAEAHIINRGDIPNTLTKKAKKNDLYTLIERDRKELEVVERESERILATK